MVKKVKKTNQELEQLQQKVADLELNYRRVLADYQNQERRHKEMESQLVKMASATIIEKILLSLDSLELAQKHLNDKGLQMVIDQLLITLQSEGLEEIKTKDENFDPNTMDCLEIVEGKKDAVIENVSKGYTLYEKVLRPAKVKVGSGLQATDPK